MNLDEAALLVRRATARHIRQMIVAGRQVTRDGVLQGIDLTQVQNELNAQVRKGMPEFISWQQVAGRFRQRLRAFYGSGLHRCG